MEWRNAYLTTIFVCWPGFILAQEAAPMLLGQEVSKQINRGEVHRYLLELSPRATQIIVRPSYFDVAVSIRHPDGSQLTKVDSPSPHMSDEYLLLTSEEASSYIVEIANVSEESASGNYTLNVTQPNLSEEMLIAGSLTTSAAEINTRNPKDDRRAALQNAIKLYQQSADAWQAVGDLAQQRRSLILQGWLALELGELDLAETSFINALALKQANDKRRAWASAYLASVRLDQDDLESAEQLFRTALKLAQRNKDRRGEVAFLNYLGLVNQYKNSPATAAGWYQQALAKLKQIDYPSQKAVTFGNIGGTHYQMGDFAQALEYYESALAFHVENNDMDPQATVLGNMASLYRDQGDLSQSLDVNLQSLAIYQTLGDTHSIDQVLYRLGILFQRMGDFRRSKSYYLRAYEGRKKSGIPRRAANSLRNLAALYAEQGDSESAHRTYLEALALYKEVNRKADIARTQIAIAAGLIKQNQHKSAKVFLDDALPVLKQAELLPDVADGLMQLAHYTAANGKPDAAKVYFKDALSIQQQVNDPIGEIAAYVAMANLEKDPADALRQLNHGELIAQRIRQGVANPALKARFSATLQNLYNSVIDAHLAQHSSDPTGEHARLAFMASERNRARSLLQLVNQSSVSESAETSKILQQQTTLRRRLHALWSSTNRLRARNNNQEIQQLITANDAAITDIMTQLDNLTAELVEAPLPAKTDTGININEIQSALSSDELLLHIHLGETQSAIWRISEAQASVSILPSRKVVEEIAEDAYGSLRRKKFVRSDQERIARLAKLLIKDQSILAEKRNVYIVADGLLQYTPFSALFDLADENALDSTAFVNLPSSRWLLRQRLTPQFSAKTSALVYADPVFGDTDFRAQLGAAEVLASNELSRAVTSVGFDRVNRLAFSSIEASEIASNIPAASIISGFNASKSDVFARNLEETEILHFATHGIVNDKVPALSGLILSLIDKEQNEKNGFLSVSDIGSLAMNPDLVVLSACETGIGEVLAGEGLLSLARAFLGQGADHVVSSLWQVNDRATAELMGHFYQALIKQQMPIPHALRYAQNMIADQPQWSAPYYWAGFTVSSTGPLGLK